METRIVACRWCTLAEVVVRPGEVSLCDECAAECDVCVQCGDLCEIECDGVCDWCRADEEDGF